MVRAACRPQLPELPRFREIVQPSQDTQCDDFCSVGRVSLVQLEAVGTWQWCNFLESLAPAGKQIVRINLDETCVRLCTEATKGAVAVGRNRSRKEALVGEHKASLSARRMAVTLVASVCDDTEIQALLPQVILGNQRVMSKAEAHRMNAEPDASVYCVRQKSSWLNKEVLSKLVHLMGVALKPWQQSRYFVLCMDACPCHCCVEVVRACNKAGLHVCYVAASMTSVLQPCDTHVFARLKRFLRAGVERLRLQSETGETQTYDVLRLIGEAVRCVLNKNDWKEAFAQTGLRDVQRGVSKSTLRKLEWTEVPQIGSGLPSLAQLQQIYPGNFMIPLANIFQLCASPPLADALEVDALGPTSNASVWAGRLRSGTGNRTPASVAESDAREKTGNRIIPAPASAADEGSSAAASSSQQPIPRARRLFPASWLPPPKISQPPEKL